MIHKHNDHHKSSVKVMGEAEHKMMGLVIWVPTDKGNFKVKKIAN